MKLRMPAPVKAHSRTKKAQRKARGLPYDGSYSSSPNGIVTTHSYEPNRDLLTSIVDAKNGTTLSNKAYSYDAIGRPTARTMNERSDTFAYDSKSQLTAAQLGSDTYGYAFDNIGNRKTAQELAEEITYATNSTNEYTAVNDFTPEFDADSNQTKLQTSTGIWNVEYNAENRPTKFTSEDGNTIVEAAYDYMGRRVWQKVTINGTITSFEAYIYRGYLQIAAIDLRGANAGHFGCPHSVCCADFPQRGVSEARGLIAQPQSVTWDPTQPEATRPLAIEKNGKWYSYGLDLSKNVTELYSAEGTIATSYKYNPFGAVEASGSESTRNPIQWSSEVYDEELGLVYYNYRSYNPADGRWINRDSIAEEGGLNLYGFVGNRVWKWDVLGNKVLRTEKFVLGDKSQPNYDHSKLEELLKKYPRAEGLTFISNKSFFDKELDIEYKEKGNIICISKVKEREFIIRQYTPSPTKELAGYTANGVNVIIDHEKNRELTYYIADEYYIRPVPIILQNVCACKSDKSILEAYASSVDEYSFELFSSYIKNENLYLSNDMHPSNFIKNKNGEVDGVVTMHTPNQTPPIMQAPPRDKKLFFKII